VTTGEQTTGRNRPLTVITSDLIMFTMEAERWESSWGGTEVMTVKVYKAEPGNGTPSIMIAEFPDVNAVYFSGDVTLVKADET
jgi:hypothetical protein